MINDITQIGQKIAESITSLKTETNNTISGIDNRVTILETQDNLGTVLQIKGTRSNTSWGTIGHSNPFAITSVDNSIITKGLNSKFLIDARYTTNDTNSSTSGAGIGIQYSINGGTFTDLWTPARHEQYGAYSSDTYDTLKLTRLSQTEIQVPIGTTIVFRLMGRTQNSNLTFFGGNGAPYYAQELIVQEIANI